MAGRESATQRCYGLLKTAILSGDFEAGHLDIQMLADRLRVSLTPIRECLARLAAERLVDFHPRHGYSLPVLGADALADLYVWSGQLADLSLRGVRHPIRLDPAVCAQSPWRLAERGGEPGYACAVSLLLFEIAQSQPNQELVDKVAQNNDRLFRARRCEPAVIRTALDELSALTALWREDVRTTLLDRLGHLHSERVSYASEIAAKLVQCAPSRAI